MAQSDGEAAPSDNLYVTELPFDTTEDSLRSMFGPGVAQCRVLPSKTPGQGTCVALVRFSSVKEAVLVRETLNGAIPPGQTRPVNIRFAGRPDHGGSSGGYGKGSTASAGTARSAPYPQQQQQPQQQSGSRAPNDNLYVTGLPPGIDNESVRQLFSQYGSVTQCKVLPAPSEKSPRHALVRFTSAEEAAEVKRSLTGYALEGVNEPLVIEFAIKKDGQEGKGMMGGGCGGGCGGGMGGSHYDFHKGQGCGKGDWGGKGMDSGCGRGDWGCKGMDSGCGKGDWGCKGMDPGYGKGDWGFKGDWGCKGEWGGKGDWGKGDWGGKGMDGKGKGDGGMSYGGMEQILQGFLEAQCLPGHKLGNEDNCLFISGLPKDCDDIHLYRLLAPFGAITPTGVKAMKYPDGACKGFGFVNFIDPADMQAAAAMLHGTQLPDGSSMSVIPKKPGKGSKKG